MENIPGVTQPPESTDLFAKANEFVGNLFKPLGQPVGQVAGQIGKAINPSWEHAFQAAGEQLPRLGAEAALTGGKGLLPKALGFGDVALQSLGETADQGLTPSQRLGTAALQTGAFAAAPKVGEKVADVAGRLAAPTAAKLPTTAGALLQGAARKGGSLVGTLGAFETANAVSSEIMNKPYDPLNADHIGGTLATVLPFEALGLPANYDQFKIDRNKLWYDKLAKGIQGESAAKAPIVTQQRETEDIAPKPQAMPATMEHDVPKDMQAQESALRGPFALRGTGQLMSEFPRRFNPTQVFSRLQNTLHPDEFNWYKDQGLMDVLTEAKSTGEVAKWMQETGPKVEVKKFGASPEFSKEQQEHSDLSHWWDTTAHGKFALYNDTVQVQLEPTMENNYRNSIDVPLRDTSNLVHYLGSMDAVNKVRRLAELNKSEQLRNTTTSDQAHWSSIAPKSETDMPGYVEGAVTLPTHEGPLLAGRSPASEQVGREHGVLFPSTHSFPPNTLGFFRGYMEPRPDGGKTFHVVEVQSDWAQQVQKAKETKARDDARGYLTDSETERRLNEKGNHPLLRDYERLTLKAAIDHAQKEGADRIAVSDAETAMMTEGHDRAGTVDLGDSVGLQQEPGMRLHYDKTLPKALEELTGAKGERKEYGTHKMALVKGSDYQAEPPLGLTPETRARYITAGEKPREDLIFKNPDGTPKTSVSANEYPLDKLNQLNKPFSLFGRDKLATRLSKPFTQETLGDLGKLDDFLDPQDTVDVAEKMAAFDRRPRESLLDFMTRSLGIHVDLNKPADKEQLLSDSKKLIENYTKNILGMDDARADYWTEKYLRLVQMVGSTQKETRVLPALPYTKDQELKSASFYAPSRSEMPNAFIGVFQHTGHTPDRNLFEFFHSTAHELFHGAMLQAEGKTFTGEVPPKMLDAAKGVLKQIDDLKLTTEEMGQAIHSTLRFMSGSPYKSLLEYRYKHYTPDAEGRMEFAADFFGLQAMGAASPRTLKPFKAIDDLLKFTNDDVREFARGVFRDFGVMLDFLGELVKRVFGWKPSSQKVLTDLAGNMRKMMQSAQEADNANEAFLRTQDLASARPWAPVQGVDYARVEQLYHSLGMEETDKDVDLFRKEASVMFIPQQDKDLPEELGLGKRLKPWNFLDPQLYRSIPQWADVRWIGRNIQNLSRESAMNMFGHWVDPQTQKYNVDAIVRLGRNGNPLNAAFNAIQLKQQALSGPDEGQRLSSTTVKSMKEYQALSPDDKVFMDRFLDQYSASMQHAAQLRVGSLKDQISHTVARAFQNIDNKMSGEDAEKLGKALTTTFVDVDRLNGSQEADPEYFKAYVDAQKTLAEWAAKDPVNAARLQSVSEIFTHDKGKPLPPGEVPDIARKFMEFRGKLLGSWDAPTKPGEVWHFSGKPGYSPEVRLGRWHVAWKAKDGRDSMVAFDKKADFDAKMKELIPQQEAGKLDYLKPFDKEDQKDLFRGLRPDMYNTLVNAITATNNRVIEKISQLNPGNEEVLNELRDELKPARMIVNALIETPYMKQRRLIGGRETLNMFQGGVHYINSTAYTVGKTYSRGQQSLLLNDPKMLANPNLRKYARQYFSEITDPTEKGFGWFKNLMSMNYIFLSPSLAMVEFTQQMTNHLPALLNTGMPMRDAVKALTDANVQMAKAWARGGYKKDHVYESPEKTAAVQWAVKNNIIDSGWLSELFPLGEDLPFINARNHLVGDGTILDRTGLIGKPLYHGFKFARDAHGLAIRVNQEAAFTSSWDRLRTQIDPKTGQQYAGQALLRAAAELTDESMHGGGRASRPLWYLGIGQPNFGANAGGLMYFLQTYVYSTVSQLARYSKNAIANSGLSDSERNAALKAASAMIGSQLFLAGAMGLPVMGQALALVEQAFPNTEPKRRAREMFYGIGKWLNSKTHLAGQDEQMGHFVADTALDGLASQLTPWNMSNRFELGVLLGVDPYKGFSWGNVVGPGGNLLEQMLLKPAQALGEGRPLDAAIQAIPNSNLRRLASLASNGWNIRNKDDRLNIDLTPGEAWSQAMGFTPRRVKQFQDENAMKIRAEAVQALEQKQFHSDQAAQLMNGQAGAVRSALLQRAHDVENYDPTEGAKQIAELVRQRSEEFDPMREGSRSGGTYNVGQLFEGPSGASTSEVQRLRQKQALVQALGFRPSLGLSSLREAELVDRLVELHPGLSKLQAKVMLERTLQPRKFAYPGGGDGQ